MTDTVLFQTPFLWLIDRDGYVFVHEKRANGHIVSLLPYRDRDGQRDYLARIEVCPAHGTEPERCSITGGVDEGKSVIEMAVMELHEEAGYQVESSALIGLGQVRPSKGSDTTVHLFAVDVTGLTAGEAKGDGSRFEVGASTEWITLLDAVEVQDPLFLAAIIRLNRYKPLKRDK